MKNLLIIISQSPLESTNPLKRIKTALALASSIGELKTTLFLSGDGIYYGLKDLTAGGLNDLWDAFRAVNCEIMLEKESMQARKIPQENLLPDIKPISRKNFIELLSQNQHCLKL